MVSLHHVKLAMGLNVTENALAVAMGHRGMESLVVRPLCAASEQSRGLAGVTVGTQTEAGGEEGEAREQ